MAIEGLAELFQASEDLTQEQIIGLMLDPENIILKTEIPNVRAYACLRLIEQVLEDNDLPLCANAIHCYLDNYLLGMVSSERKSRGEIERMIAAMREPPMGDKVTVENKLFGRGGKDYDR